MQKLLPIVAFLAFPWTALALEPMTVDILTFRLGMTEAAVVQHLHEQGIDGPDIGRLDDICAPGDSCAPVLIGRTRDGALTFAFTRDAADRFVTGQIVYRLPARRTGEPAAIQSATFDRYGPPNGVKPMSWCRTPDTDRRCPADRPRLSLERGPGTMLVLTLGDGVTPGPAERGQSPGRIRGLHGPSDPTGIIQTDASGAQQVIPRHSGERRSHKRRHQTSEQWKGQQWQGQQWRGQQWRG
jgi:hypothetical protein